MRVENRSFDVVIIGGGVSGCSTASFLAAEPAFDGTICVVEKDPSYANAPSARAAGVIRQQFSTPENIRMSMFAAEFVKSIDQYLSVDGQTPEVGFKEHGFLLLADANNSAVIEDNCRIQWELGVETELLSADELRQRFPFIDNQKVFGGSMGRVNEGWLDPYSLLQAYRRKAQSLGVAFISDEAVATRISDAPTLSVQLKGGDVLSSHYIVNACGARDINALMADLGIELPIEPRKRTMFAFDCRDDVGTTPHIVLPNGISVRRETSGYLTAASPPPDWPDPPDVGAEPDFALFDDYIWPSLAAHIPAFEAIKLSTAYCCHYDFNVLDENVIIDHLPGNNRYFFVTGFSGHGLQQSPAIGRALSELITFGEYRSLDLSRFGFSRVLANEPLLETNCF